MEPRTTRSRRVASAGALHPHGIGGARRRHHETHRRRPVPAAAPANHVVVGEALTHVDFGESRCAHRRGSTSAGPRRSPRARRCHRRRAATGVPGSGRPRPGPIRYTHARLPGRDRSRRHPAPGRCPPRCGRDSTVDRCDRSLRCIRRCVHHAHRRRARRGAVDQRRNDQHLRRVARAHVHRRSTAAVGPCPSLNGRGSALQRSSTSSIRPWRPPHSARVRTSCAPT